MCCSSVLTRAWQLTTKKHILQEDSLINFINKYANMFLSSRRVSDKRKRHFTLGFSNIYNNSHCFNHKIVLTSLNFCSYNGELLS